MGAVLVGIEFEGLNVVLELCGLNESCRGLIKFPKIRFSATIEDLGKMTLIFQLSGEHYPHLA